MEPPPCAPHPSGCCKRPLLASPWLSFFAPAMDLLSSPILPPRKSCVRSRFKSAVPWVLHSSSSSPAASWRDEVAVRGPGLPGAHRGQNSRHPDSVLSVDARVRSLNGNEERGESELGGSGSEFKAQRKGPTVHSTLPPTIFVCNEDGSYDDHRDEDDDENKVRSSQGSGGALPLWLTHTQFRLHLFEAARMSYPNETCGVVLCMDETTVRQDGVTTEAHLGKSRMIHVVSLENVQDKNHARNPRLYPSTARHAFSVDPVHLQQVLDGVYTREPSQKQPDSLKPQWIGMYHSHCDCECYFSKEDRHMAMLGAVDGKPRFPTLVHAIAEVRNGIPVAYAAYQWTDMDGGHFQNIFHGRL